MFGSLLLHTEVQDFGPENKYHLIPIFYDLPVMPDELHIVSLVALFDAVHTDGVAVCCVTGVTPIENR